MLSKCARFLWARTGLAAVSHPREGTSSSWGCDRSGPRRSVCPWRGTSLWLSRISSEGNHANVHTMLPTSFLPFKRVFQTHGSRAGSRTLPRAPSQGRCHRALGPAGPQFPKGQFLLGEDKASQTCRRRGFAQESWPPPQHGEEAPLLGRCLSPQPLS